MEDDEHYRAEADNTMWYDERRCILDQLTGEIIPRADIRPAEESLENKPRKKLTGNPVGRPKKGKK